jgi:pilus assembly protein CpaB
MRRNGRMLIVAGVALALVAAVLAVVVLSGGSSDKDKTGSTTNNSSPKDVMIVQAKKDVSAHTLLSEDDLEEVKVDAATASPDAVHAIGEVIGFAYNTDLKKGQRLLQANLEEPGLANSLTAGKRAVSLPVDKNNLIGGLLRDDDHIDITYAIRIDLTGVLPTSPVESAAGASSSSSDQVLPPYGQAGDATYPYPGEPGSRFLVSDTDEGEPMAKVVLQDIRVLRVVNADDSSGASGTSSGDYIVLEVDPAQLELINMMQTIGTYKVSLRNSSDTAQVTTDGMNVKDLVTKLGFPIPSTVRLPGPGAQ